VTIALTEEERRDLLVSIGTHRGQRRLSPMDVARLFQKAIDAGASLAQCASAAGLAGTEMVKRFLRLLDLPPSAQTAVSWGGSDTTLAFSAASEIARLAPSLQELTAHEALARGLSSSEIKQVVQRITRSGLGSQEAIAEIVALRPVVERRHVIIGMLSSSTVGKRIEELEQDARDDLLARVLEKLIGEQRAASRLTPTGFVITGNEALAEMIHGLGDFEATISAAVGEQLGLT
jgi:hypothetical protein